MADNKWKVLRGLLSPTFTMAKMKTLSTSMQAGLVDFGDRLKRDISQSISGKLEKRDIRQYNLIYLNSPH